jgi:hypothetical protein
VCAPTDQKRELGKGISVSISASESKCGLTRRNYTVGIREVVQRYVLKGGGRASEASLGGFS